MGDKNEDSPTGESDVMSPGSDEPSLIQYRSKRRCVVEREKKKKKEWWEDEDVLSDEDDQGDGDSDSSDGPKRPKQRRKMVFPAALLPPPNRIFMFSTELANRAAEAVSQGRVPSIVAYHMAQPQNQRYLKLQQQRHMPEFGMNPAVSAGNPYHYSNFPRHMSNMETMFAGIPPSHAPPVGMTSMPQIQQYLKQQQQMESRNTLAVDELQQMLFGANNGTPKGMFPATGMSRMMDDQAGVRPKFPAGYTGPLPPTFGQQQMFMNNHNYKLPPNFPTQQMQSQVEAPTTTMSLKSVSVLNATPEEGAAPRQQTRPVQNDSQKQEIILENEETTVPQSDHKQQICSTVPSAVSHQPSPALSTTVQQTAPQLPVLSPGSSLSSSSPIGSTIRSPPPYPTSRPTELNTLPGASSIGAPSPTNTNSPQTPHGPHTPRLSTSLASPKDGQRSPFSPGATPTSGYPGQPMTQQNIHDAGMKLAESSHLEKSENLPTSKNLPPGFMPNEMRIPGYNRQDMLLQRPNSLNLSKNVPPAGLSPNKGSFLGGGSVVRSAMGMPPDPIHHPSKFSVESLTAPAKEEHFYRQRFPMQPGNPYAVAAAAAYSQQQGLYYPGNKFLPGMLGQSQYQFPPHIQPTPQQFFPSNMPPQMYPPHGPFSIHHTGNRDGGM